MRLRCRPLLLGAVGLLAVAGLGGGCSRQPPNVVVIVIDTLRQDRLGVYGYQRPTSPVIDRLAAEGVRADGVSPTSWTKPATVSLLSGLHPLRHQTFARGDALPDSLPLLAEVMQRRGYHTAAYSANSWVSRAWGFERGFDEFYLMKSLGLGHHAPAQAVVGSILERTANLKPPYFLYVHFTDPHAPYAPPEGWGGGPLPAHLVPFAPMTDDKMLPHSMNPSHRSRELLAAASELYDLELHHADRQIGALLRALEERNLGADLVVVTADHGEEFEDHGRMGHGHTLYREQTAVPMVFWGPGRVPAGRVMGRASLMDVLPTLLELTGLGDELADLGPLDGRSLVPRLAGEAPGTTPPEGLILHLDFDSGHSVGWVEGPNKLLLQKNPYLKGVFDLAGDPREQENVLTRSSPEQFARLAEGLARGYNTLARQAQSRRSTVMDEELAESIRALGYVAHSNSRGDARILPARLLPADPTDGGLLGWEGGEPFASCLDLGKNESERQVLAGWYGIERKHGRWTAPTATAVLAVPPAPEGLRWRIEGVNYRTTPVDLTLSAAGQTLFSARQVGLGAFQLRADLDPPFALPEVLRLGLTADPPFVPAQQMASTDTRVLGIFLTKLCLEARSPGGVP